MSKSLSQFQLFAALTAVSSSAALPALPRVIVNRYGFPDTGTQVLVEVDPETDRPVRVGVVRVGDTRGPRYFSHLHFNPSTSELFSWMGPKAIPREMAGALAELDYSVPERFWVKEDTDHDAT